MNEQQRIVEWLVKNNGGEGERWFWRQAVADVLGAQKAVIADDLARAISARKEKNGGSYTKASH